MHNELEANLSPLIRCQQQHPVFTGGKIESSEILRLSTFDRLDVPQQLLV